MNRMTSKRYRIFNKMKQYRLLLVPIFVLLFTTGCGTDVPSDNSAVETDGEGKATISVSKTEYVIPPPSSGAVVGTDYLAIELEIKNSGDGELHIDNEDFELIESDTGTFTKSEILSQQEEGYLLSYETIAPDDQLTRAIIFTVSPDKQYQLAYTPPGSERSDSLIIAAIDPSLYLDTKEQLTEPEKAAQAYVDVMLLGKENPDFEKYLDIDQESISNNIKNHFLEIAYPSEDKDVSDQIYQQFIATQSVKSSAEVNLLSNMGGIATVNVKPTVIDFYDARLNYLDMVQTNAVDMSLVQTALNEANIVTSNSLVLYLKKSGDKWTVDLDEDAKNNGMNSSFSNIFYQP